MVMENVRYSRVLEITSSYIKFTVGYILKDTPKLLYYKKTPIKDLVVDGRIKDRQKLIEALEEFHSIEDPAFDIHMEPNAVSIVLPSVGFKVYQCDKATRVVGSDDTIAPVDVENVMMLINKQSVEQGNVIVDVVPDVYVANAHSYKEPPLGVKSEQLTAKTKVYTLPSDILASYKQVVEEAGFRVLRSAVAVFCASRTIQTEAVYPESYVLFDMGSDLTTVSFIGKNNPYMSRFSKFGGRPLSEKMAKDLNISFDLANELKEKYGYDKTEHKFETPLYAGLNLNGENVKIYQKDLNASIESYFANFQLIIKSALNELKAGEGQEYGSFPILITGGASRLKGIGNLLAPMLGGRRTYAYTPRIIGAREPEATNILGMIIAEGSNKKASFMDNYRGVSALRRE